QISQGPIGRYTDMAPSLYAPRKFCYNSFVLGLERMLLGFFKKIVVADNIGIFVNQIYDTPSTYSGLTLLFATICYGIQLYADFSGYMDITLGVSRCFGITLAENFDTPYFSKSISEFWRRWHISLSSWFRDYLYYPILRSKLVISIGKTLSHKGYKKCSKSITTSIGLLITWLFIGLWHGSTLNYIFYGLYHGFFIIIDASFSSVYQNLKNKLGIKQKSHAWQLFQMFRTFFIVCIGYILFRSDNLSTASIVFNRIITNISFKNLSAEITSELFTKSYWSLIAVSISILYIIELIERKMTFAECITKLSLPTRWIILYSLILFILFVSLFTDITTAGSGNFLYFNF
ncbi:MAG: MBOAT family protein, partial [Clostridia bacterium]|nr:MBOAT family protein [Clostridia bacterium]